MICGLLDRLLRILRFWPGPTEPIGSLTNKAIDDLPEAGAHNLDVDALPTSNGHARGPLSREDITRVRRD